MSVVFRRPAPHLFGIGRWAPVVERDGVTEWTGRDAGSHFRRTLEGGTDAGSNSISATYGQSTSLARPMPYTGEEA